jgi:ATP-binding protein involved in chromosome partitioning
VTEYDVRGWAEVGGEDRSDLPGQLREQRRRVAVRLAGIGRVVAVASGKGGVGKSLVAASLAAALSEAGSAVGLLDADLDSPTGARMLDARGARLRIGDDGVRPPEVAGGVRLVSTDLVLGEDAPLELEGPDGDGWVWRGAQERGVLREFLSDVAWGELDVLVVDLPPGTSRFDQLVGLVPDLAGTVFVTIPSDASAPPGRRSMRRTADGEVRDWFAS